MTVKNLKNKQNKGVKETPKSGIIGPDIKDKRDYIADYILGASSDIPTMVQLPVKNIYNQGMKPYCSAYSSTQATEILNRQEHGEVNKFEAMKLADKMLENGTMKEYGAYLRDAVKTMLDMGGSFDKDGKQYPIKGFATVYPSQYKDYIAKGYPIYLGMFLDQFDLEGDTFVYNGENRSNGHAIVLTGYDDETKTYTITNSWGDKWGSKGQAKVSYDDIKHFFDARIIYDAQDIEYVLGYKDITKKHWGADAVEWVSNNGIMKGYNDGKEFRPDNPISRVEMAQVLHNLYLKNML